MTRHLRFNQHGSIALTSLVMIAVITFIGYQMAGFLNQAFREAIQEELIAEADILVNDLNEFSKYLILYEKAFYTDGAGPLDHRGPRGDQLIKLWSQGLGAGINDAELTYACGGYDGMGRPIGRYTLGGSGIFCPSYLRSNFLDNTMLEQMLFEHMVTKGALKRPEDGQRGAYDLEIVYFDASRGIDRLTEKEGGFITFNQGQNLFNFKKDKLILAKTRIRFLTDSSGFKSVGSERMIEISSQVEIGNSTRPVVLTTKEEFLLHPSSPKDFALFMMYPTKADGLTPTNRYSEAVKLPVGTDIKGRVFFNGDIDVPIDALPTFHEIVVITGSLTAQTNSSVMRQKLKRKFLKGVITNYSAPRLLQSGACSPLNPDLNISNNSGFNCKTESGSQFSIIEYFKRIPSPCNDVKWASHDGVSTPTCNIGGGSDCESSCTPENVITGAKSRPLLMTGEYHFIAAPVAKLDIRGGRNTHIYGTIFGGHVQADQPVTFKSLASVTVGDPGIGSDATLDNYNYLFQTAIAGVGVPIVNLPIVYTGGGQ